MTAPATPERPQYRKVPHQHGRLWMIVADEGWRQSIVCDSMYEWAADWLLSILGQRPYTPGPH